MLIAFSLISLFYLVNWIGFLFALPMFDYFAKQCKEMWFGHLVFTLMAVLNTVSLFLNPEKSEAGYMKFILFIALFGLFITVIGKVCSTVHQFHTEQKVKRNMK